jgi:hypothetical protein
MHTLDKALKHEYYLVALTGLRLKEFQLTMRAQAA